MQTTTGDAALIKKMNTAIVLDCILHDASLSRAQISKRTGLNKTTVSNLVQDLIDLELVIEIGTGQSSGGRKPVMLLFNSRAGYAVGVELGVNTIRGVLTDLEGAVIRESTTDLRSQQLTDVLPPLFDLIAKLMDGAPDSHYGIVGIGIGVPGIVNSEGEMLFSPNLEGDNVSLMNLVSERFRLPVTIDNEANVGAQGEQKYGVGKGIANLIYISAGIGIGAGVIINSKLYKGQSGFAGEVGHLSIQMDGASCRCGNLGCWEMYASEKSLLQLTASLHLHSIDDVCKAAKDGNQQVIDFIRQIGVYLGVGLTSIIHVFNPEAVIIGNNLSMLEPWIGESIRETVARRTLSHHRDSMQLLFAELRERSTLRGAAFNASDNFLKKMKGV